VPVEIKEPTTLPEIKERLASLSATVLKAFEEAGPERDFSRITVLSGDTAAKAAEIQRLNAEMTALGTKRDEMAGWEALGQNAREIDAAYNRPAPGARPVAPNGKPAAQARSLGEILAQSQEYQAFQSGRIKTASFEITGAELRLMELEARYGPEIRAATLTLGDINNPATRRPGIVESAQETATVRDLMLPGTTDNNTLTYMEETTFTNAAATVAEGGTKPESALDFTERTDNVRKIATWIPATRELLQDVRGIESYIRGRLMFMVRRTEEAQLLRGDGVAPNILGVQVRVGVQTQAKGADSVPAAVYKAMTKVRTIGFAEPTAAVFHPNDWQDVRLLTTTDGIFIWGPPMDPGPERIWGLPVRITTGEVENTALVGAFRPMAQVFEREGITITVSTEHSTFFVENKVAILAEERLALAVYRPAAFCTVTGI
jgi:HK97 family phage major capsid protein